jgi:hypothetical protein
LGGREREREGEKNKRTGWDEGIDDDKQKRLITSKI